MTAQQEKDVRIYDLRCRAPTRASRDHGFKWLLNGKAFLKTMSLLLCLLHGRARSHSQTIRHRHRPVPVYLWQTELGLFLLSGAVLNHIGLDGRGRLPIPEPSFYKQRGCSWCPLSGERGYMAHKLISTMTVGNAQRTKPIDAFGWPCICGRFSASERGMKIDRSKNACAGTAPDVHWRPGVAAASDESLEDRDRRQPHCVVNTQGVLAGEVSASPFVPLD